MKRDNITVQPDRNNNGSAPDMPESRYTVFVSTHPGRTRDQNEDNFVVNKTVRIGTKSEEHLRGSNIREPLVCGVFDGMGGEAYGEQCSAIAAQTSAIVYKTLRKNLQHPYPLVERFANEANEGIVGMIADARAQRGGSTFVMAVFIDGRVYAYSLGDSRMYLYSNGLLRQITNDHTLAMKKYRANIYTLEEANASPDSHKLTDFLGVDQESRGVAPEQYPPFVLGPDDKLLLCSDGLYDMCGDDEILSVMKTDSDTISLDLVDKAVENGGVDNVTCIVIKRA